MPCRAMSTHSHLWYIMLPGSPPGLLRLQLSKFSKSLLRMSNEELGLGIPGDPASQTTSRRVLGEILDEYKRMFNSMGQKLNWRPGKPKSEAWKAAQSASQRFRYKRARMIAEHAAHAVVAAAETTQNVPKHSNVPVALGPGPTGGHATLDPRHDQRDSAQYDGWYDQQYKLSNGATPPPPSDAPTPPVATSATPPPPPPPATVAQGATGQAPTDMEEDA
eukprot:m.66613 g.66613  ORF g.66613 m.66613 type:complete len:220 (-) comp8371_c0_seq2:1320-1979(-)